MIISLRTMWGFLATENNHAKNDLDVAKEYFDGLAAQVEFSDFVGMVED
ncbi:MAG: hypothetical protein WCI03_02410 [bacterium]